MAVENPPGVSLWQAVTALLGLLQAGFTLGLGWLWSRITAIESRIEKNADHAAAATRSGDRDLWEAFNAERTRAEQHRATILEKVAGLPTKDDLAAMEGRLSQRIGRQP